MQAHREHFWLVLTFCISAFGWARAQCRQLWSNLTSLDFRGLVLVRGKQDSLFFEPWQRRLLCLSLAKEEQNSKDLINQQRTIGAEDRDIELTRRLVAK